MIIGAVAVNDVAKTVSKLSADSTEKKYKNHNNYKDIYCTRTLYRIRYQLRTWCFLFLCLIWYRGGRTGDKKF
jgi:hypothetical protein